ncbi:unnamed protein product, partial [Discosporangium mesarthrocarpum]
MGDEVPSWAIGVAINVLGSVAINLGTNIMKLSHKLEKGEVAFGHQGDKTAMPHSISSQNSTAKDVASIEMPPDTRPLTSRVNPDRG